MAQQSNPQQALAKIQRVNAKEGQPVHSIFESRLDTLVRVNDVNGLPVSVIAGDPNFGAAPSTSENADFNVMKAQLNATQNQRYRLSGK